MKPVRGRLDGTGRVNIPVEFRRIIGLEDGGDVVVELDRGAIRIRRLDEVVSGAQSHARRIVAGKPDATVRDFIDERLPQVDLE